MDHILNNSKSIENKKSILLNLIQIKSFLNSKMRKLNQICNYIKRKQIKYRQELLPRTSFARSNLQLNMMSHTMQDIMLNIIFLLKCLNHLETSCLTTWQNMLLHMLSIKYCQSYEITSFIGTYSEYQMYFHESTCYVTSLVIEPMKPRCI